MIFIFTRSGGLAATHAGSHLSVSLSPSLAGLLAAVLIGTALVPPVPNQIGPRANLDLRWSQELVDAKLGVFPTTAIGLQDGIRPAIAYNYGTKQELHFAVRNGSTWEIEVVDSLGLFVPSLNFEDGRTTVAYTNLNAPPDRGLRFAERIGGKWTIQDIHPQTVGPQLSMISGPDGHRVIAFEAYPTGLPGVLHGLLFAKETASGWNVSAIDSGESGVGSVSVARSGGTYAIAFATLDANYTTHAKLALGDGLTWRIQQIATEVQVGYTSIFVTFDSSGALHLFFVRLRSDTLVHRYQQGPTWAEEVIDNGTRPGDIGVHMSVTIGPDGEPRLAYLVGDVYRFMYAVRGKSGWAYSEINRSLNRGFFPSLAVDPSDRPHVAFIDAGFPPTTEDLWYATASPGSANRPPEPRPSVSGKSLEGVPILFDASNSSDPDGDPLEFRWDFDSDGTWDTAFSSDPTATHMWGDDFVGTVTVAVSDGRLTSTATVPVAIRNVPPRIPSLAASVDSVVRVRLAGEKGHSVTATLLQAGNEIPLLTLVRSPGPPQEASVRIAIDPTANASLRLAYDSLGGEPSHGANPTWVTVAFDDGSSASFEHTFNAKHPETGTWIVGLNSLLTGRAVRFAATAHDPGSDDLTLTWAFGDGSALSSIYYNNGASPDPYPSPDANPITVIDARVHTYASPGLYTVTLIVIDDDGGMAILFVHVDVR